MIISLIEYIGGVLGWIIHFFGIPRYNMSVLCLKVLFALLYAKAVLNHSGHIHDLSLCLKN